MAMSSSALMSLITRAYQVLKTKNPAHHPTPGGGDGIEDIHLSPEIKSLTDMMHSLSADGIKLHRICTPKVVKVGYITFLEVLENSVMTVVIIAIPPGGKIPLHDHPNMLGFIKVLHGQVRLTTYSKLGEGDGDEGRQPGLMTQDSVISRLSYPQVLTPSTNNVHAIEYLSGEGGKDYAAFLDILCPPYNDLIGCHYYILEFPKDEEDYYEEVEEEERGESSTSKGNSSSSIAIGNHHRHLLNRHQYGPRGGEKCVLVQAKCPKEYRTITCRFPFL